MFLSRERKLSKALKQLLSKAIMLGLGNEARSIVEEYIDHMEFGLAFDQLLYELYEINIRITTDYYEEIMEVAASMQIDQEEYKYIKTRVLHT